MRERVMFTKFVGIAWKIQWGEFLLAGTSWAGPLKRLKCVRPKVVGALALPLLFPALAQAACSFTSLYAGSSVTCGLRADSTASTARCWGKKLTADKVVPRGRTFQQLALGAYHGCGLLADQTIYCWGWDVNSDGRTRPPSFSDFTEICSGGGYSCGLRSNGLVVCWGENTWGQSSPPPETFVQVTCGADHACARRADGTVSCWGHNTYSQADPPVGVTFQFVAAGWTHTCGIRFDGQVICWGHNDSGKSTPPSGVQFAELSLGARHTCGIRTDGTIQCWGYNGQGALNAPSGTGYHALVSGFDYSCALDGSNQAVCWGAAGGVEVLVSDSVSLNNVTVYDELVCGLDAGQQPVCTFPAPPPGLPPIQKAGAGKVFGCALSAVDGAINCWGFGGSGQTNPPSETGFQDLAVGKFHACALRSDGTPACWGLNDAGQASPPPGASFVEVTAGWQHSCGRMSNGGVVCWGSNSRGQRAVPEGVTFQQIVAGASHTCGLRTDGTALCWGANDQGQSSPPRGVAFQRLVAGDDHTCGLLLDGSVLCWGRNTLGQATPPGRFVFTNLAAGGSSTCGELLSGAVVCWGLAYIDACGAPPTPCSPQPKTGCHSGAGGSLTISHPKNSNRQSLEWVLRQGPSLAVGDFGNPVGGTTSYALCLYDDLELKVASSVGPSSSRWRAVFNGYRYADPAAASDGFKSVSLRAGTAGRSSVTVNLGGMLARLPKPAPEVTLLSARDQVIVQLQQSDDTCYETVFLPSHVRSLRENSARLRY